MLEPTEVGWTSTALASQGYDQGRRTACGELLTGPVRALAGRRLVELTSAPRVEARELREIFDEVERVAAKPTPGGLTAVAGRALAAHAGRRRRSLADSIATVSAELDRRFAACESGQAGYPLRLSGLGHSGCRGLHGEVSPFYLTHALERIVESALLVGTVVEPGWAPGAYVVIDAPRSSTRIEVGALLAANLAAQQNATIDFAFEELDGDGDRDALAFEHLQCVVLALRPRVDIQDLVAHGHALLSSLAEDVDLARELGAAAEILDGSGLATQGTLALGEAVGVITKYIGGLVSSLHRTRAGGEVAAHAADLARSVLHVVLVVAWCAEHGRIRPGMITVDGHVSRVPCA